MRAVRCTSSGVTVADVPAPTGEGARVKVRSAGICGSDLHLISSPFTPSGTLGHEFAGELLDGRAVAVEPIAPCGHCARCATGEYNLCERSTSMVLGVAHDGGMAEEVLVPERAIVPLPSGIDVRDACLIEPIAVAVHGLRLAGLRADQRIAIVGAGSIGLCAAAVCAKAGARTDVVARHDGQREAALRLGANVGAPDDSGYDLVIDAAGTKGALETAVTLARPGGSLLLLATYWEGLELPGFALCMKEVRVVPSSMYASAGAARDIDTAAAVLGRNPELAPALITHRFPLAAAAEAFDAASDRNAGAIKVVLEP